MRGGEEERDEREGGEERRLAAIHTGFKLSDKRVVAIHTVFKWYPLKPMHFQGGYVIQILKPMHTATQNRKKDHRKCQQLRKPCACAQKISENKTGNISK